MLYIGKITAHLLTARHHVDEGNWVVRLDFCLNDSRTHYMRERTHSGCKIVGSLLPSHDKICNHI